MQKQTIYILLLLLTTISTACGNKSIFNKKEKVIERFDTEVSINAEKISLEALGIIDIKVVDTFIIAYTPMSATHYCKLYSAKNYNYLGPYFPKGRANNEFISVSYFGPKDESKANAKAWFYTDGNLSQWNIQESVKQKTTVIDSIISYDERIFFSGSWKIFNRNRLIGFVPSEDNVDFVVYDNEAQKAISRKPIYSQSLNPDVMQTALMYPIIKPDFSKIVYLGTFINSFYIADYNFENIKPFAIYEKPKDLYKMVNINDDTTVRYYENGSSSNNYLYFHYLNQPFSKKGNHGSKEEIHIFDWDGNPKLKIVINENLMFMDVDKKNKCILGLGADETIYKYDLSQYIDDL